MSRVLDLWAGMTGTVLDFAGTSAPDGWLLCFGQTVSRTTYANLFARIGVTYGAGDGSTTFNLPDCRGRVCAGMDNMGGANSGRLTAASGVAGSTLGATGGSQTHTLTTQQMPSHAHAIATTKIAVTAGASGVILGGVVDGNGTGLAGDGQAHNNTQPTIVFNKIIKI